MRLEVIQKSFGSLVTLNARQMILDTKVLVSNALERNFKIAFVEL